MCLCSKTRVSVNYSCFPSILSRLSLFHFYDCIHPQNTSKMTYTRPPFRHTTPLRVIKRQWNIPPPLCSVSRQSDHNIHKGMIERRQPSSIENTAVLVVGGHISTFAVKARDLANGSLLEKWSNRKSCFAW